MGCGSALVRAADAMLKALGGETVSLLLPATATASDAGGQLGLVDPGVQEIAITPVVARPILTGTLGPRRRVEFTLPASVIAAQLSSLGMATADDLFEAALGLTYGGELFHIEAVAPESFAGSVYFYIVNAVE